MVIGERIRFIRNLRGITQKRLGIKAGLPEKTADIRIAQYEHGTRVPKEDLTKKIAEVLNVSPAALTVPDIETPAGIIQTLFALEDMYGLEIDTADGGIVLRFRNIRGNEELRAMLVEWLNKALQLRGREISIDEYDDWRYNFAGWNCVTGDTFREENI